MFDEYSWEEYQSMMDHFIKSPLLLMRRSIAFMKKQKWGRIISVSSDVFFRGTGSFSAYAAAKGGQIGWSRSLATELAPYGITVNVVAPGWIPVERHGNESQESKNRYIASIPVGRWGTPEDVANAVLFLASNEASFINAQSLCVNGGMTPL
jgi:3-oxoacyl-[acyl-carrier protein] reductase